MPMSMRQFHRALLRPAQRYGPCTVYDSEHAHSCACMDGHYGYLLSNAKAGLSGPQGPCGQLLRGRAGLTRQFFCCYIRGGSFATLLWTANGSCCSHPYDCLLCMSPCAACLRCFQNPWSLPRPTEPSPSTHTHTLPHIQYGILPLHTLPHIQYGTLHYRCHDMTWCASRLCSSCISPHVPAKAPVVIMQPFWISSQSPAQPAPLSTYRASR